MTIHICDHCKEGMVNTAKGSLCDKCGMNSCTVVIDTDIIDASKITIIVDEDNEKTDME